MHFSFDTENLSLLVTEKNESTYKEGILSTLVKTVPESSYSKFFSQHQTGKNPSKLTNS